MTASSLNPNAGLATTCGPQTSAPRMAVLRVSLIVLSLLLAGRSTASDSHQSARPNVLMILVDDLKPSLGCYQDSVAVTPHLDALAKRGMTFDFAYCNQAVCAPSRYSLLLGSHPTSTGLYSLSTQLRDQLPSAVTLPQYFSSHGYRTESLGKVFHIGHGNQGDPDSFSVPHFYDKVIEYLDPNSTGGGKLTREEAYFSNQQLDRIGTLPRGAAFEAMAVDDEAYADGRVAREALKRLEAAKSRRDANGTPFFMAVGFARPHLPFSVPKKYWDLYTADRLPLPSNRLPPLDAPPVAHKQGGEITNYDPVPTNGQIAATLERELIHGYYAGVSYVDAQVGKLMQQLEDLHLLENTLIVLWGDHGFHLGDHGYWTKHTNYEQANRIPLIIVAPGVSEPGTRTGQLAESVDVYPTLVELAGLPFPQTSQRLDGKSLVPVLREPSARVRNHAYHVFPKAKLGRAIRTERYRMVEWKALNDPASAPVFELYDYQTDPHESRNLAAAQPDVLAKLRDILASYPTPLAQGGKPKSIATRN